MRTPVIAGNWKMNKTIAEAVAEIGKLSGLVSAQVEVIIYPSYVALKPLAEAVKGTSIRVGAQNMHYESKGAFTGEISPLMVKEVTNHVLIGHSERRQYFGESDAIVNMKMHAALSAGLIPTLCIGETLLERESGRTMDIVKTQIVVGLEGFDADMAAKITLAYEPVWAIGTGKTATKEQAQEVHAFIRKSVADKFGDAVSTQVRILYGGSVKPDNIADLMSMEDIDGALVGGASLDADVFARIVNFGS